MSHILAIDPSGNFKEGKGTTGLCLLEAEAGGRVVGLGQLQAINFSSAEAYWSRIVWEIEAMKPEYVVIEGYRLYNHKGMAASSQANSELETPQLIGAIKLECYKNGIPLEIQFAAEVKQRWKESVLVHQGILEERNGRYYCNGELTNDHKRDALKHALHFRRYKLNDR